MRKFALFGCVLLTACGDLFVTGSDTLTGTETTSTSVSVSTNITTSVSNSVGGSSTETTSNGGSSSGGIGGQTISTETNSSMSSSTITQQQPVEISTVSCEKDFVFSPASVYGLTGSPVVSCVKVPQGYTSLTIYAYKYALFAGFVPAPVTQCSFNDHNSVWFKTVPVIVGTYDIPSVVSINKIFVSANQASMIDWTTPKYSGKIGEYIVDLDVPQTIMNDEMFCFGHEITLNPNTLYPTCQVGCLDDIGYIQHQLSDVTDPPFNFITLDNWPADGNPKNVSLTSSVFVVLE